MTSSLSGPTLEVDVEGDSVDVRGLSVEALEQLSRWAASGESLSSVLSVHVVSVDGGADLPDVVGRFETMNDRLRFTPLFPFGHEITFRAVFDPEPVGEQGPAQTLNFGVPRSEPTRPPAVTAIYPSSEALPENLLRFYLEFSRPMRRGQAEANLALLGPDGQPVEDALYRPPVELWDRRMRRLTVLLDPGRLKRHVGPNRSLGPPLKAGDAYTLLVGAGFTDIAASPVPAPVAKVFRATKAHRNPINVGDWLMRAPRAATRDPLLITFPGPLDEAMLAHALTVIGPARQLVLGEMEIGKGETRVTFVPHAPWSSRWNDLHVAVDLEDVCGNTVYAPFDRPLRRGSDLKAERTGPSVAFRPA